MTRHQKTAKVLDPEPITQAEVRRLFSYDPEVGDLVRRVPCGTRGVIGEVAGSVVNNRGKSYIRIKIRRKSYMAHRLIYLYVEGFMPEEVDHDDGDGTNNKWLNLKSSNHNLNMKNTRRRQDNKSGVQVVYLSSTGMWSAQITFNKVQRYLGSFPCKSLAALARLKAERGVNFHKNHGTNRPL